MTQDGIKALDKKEEDMRTLPPCNDTISISKKEALLFLYSFDTCISRAITHAQHTDYMFPTNQRSRRVFRILAVLGWYH